MQFKFDPNQDFQIEAIETVAKLFDGQHYTIGQFVLHRDGLAAIPNNLEIGNEEILTNLQQVQADNDLTKDDELQCIKADINLLDEIKHICFANFSIEMETGTGKTYVYLRTILELFRRYGLRKFIIVVPSVAVREGVIKTLQITKAHFRKLYDNPSYHYYPYDSQKLSQLRQFADSPGVEILVMTIDSFNKSNNKIYKSIDQMQGEKPIHLIQATRPVLVLDEPQNMESDQSVKALTNLNPLFTLRYSATHRKHYNLIYRLTPAQAYQQGLVKRIEVDGVLQKDDPNRAFVRVNNIKNKGNTITAQLSVHKLMRDGTVKEQPITVKLGDDLAEKTNRPIYDGYIVDVISMNDDCVRFENGIEVLQGETKGEDKPAIFEAQIRTTIDTHFQKQEKLKSANIKVLSLFFIDRVDNYVSEDGLIRNLFIKCFNEIKQEYDTWRDINAEQVQAAYFASKTTKDGQIIYEDSTKEDAQVYDLIMKNKERLLSFEEQTCFIFSHSALREGWDNPNVFQICTLNQTASEMKKRQEIGRGVRLAVDQSGNRSFEPKVNVLTVIANDSYANYVDSYQKEITEEFGEDDAAPKPKPARKRKTVKLRETYIVKPEFQELWNKIRQKTRYAVNINTDKLINDVVEELDQTQIRSPQITITRAQVEIRNKNLFKAMQISRAKTVIDLAGRYPLPNLVDEMMHLLEHTTPPMRLTKRTLLAIFSRTQKKQDALNNPHEFAATAIRIIKKKLTDQLLNGIKYEKINEYYEMCQFEVSIDTWEDCVIEAEGAIYDHIIFDSENERKFVEDIETFGFVKLYLKLPDFFKVPTPIGTYNPDWAIVMEDNNGEPKLFLVRETKANKDDLRSKEKRKADCGEQHFKNTLNVDFEIIENAQELHNTEWQTQK